MPVLQLTPTYAVQKQFENGEKMVQLLGKETIKYA